MVKRKMSKFATRAKMLSEVRTKKSMLARQVAIMMVPAQLPKPSRSVEE